MSFQLTQEEYDMLIKMGNVAISDSKRVLDSVETKIADHPIYNMITNLEKSQIAEMSREEKAKLAEIKESIVENEIKKTKQLISLMTTITGKLLINKEELVIKPIDPVDEVTTIINH